METMIFENSQFGSIRTGTLESSPIFCLADLCNILGIKNVPDCKSRLNKDGIVITDTIDRLGRQQSATFISESNLYKVVFQSRKPEAEQFTEWVTSEVLPSIRKNGIYATDYTIENMLSNPENAIKVFTALKEERTKRQLAEQTVKEQEPKVLFANSVAGSNNSVLVKDLATILKQNGIEIGQNRLYEWLRENGYLLTKGEYYNRPSQKALEIGLFEVIVRTNQNATKGSFETFTTKVTGKGQIYFVNKFLKHGNSNT